MRKYIKSIISIIIVLAVSLSIFASACGKETYSDPNADRRLRIKSFEGLHDYTAPDAEGEKFLFKDGKTDYVLIAPEKSSEFERLAKNEFVLLFKRATGIQISTKVDIELSDNTKFISLGETAQYDSLNVTAEEKAKLTADGVRIITKDDNIYIYGGESSLEKKQGVLYGVYTFMQIYFNYDYFYRNCMTLDTGVTEAKLKNFNVWDVPDLPGRQPQDESGNEKFHQARWYELDAGLTNQDTINRMYRSRSESYTRTMATWTTLGDYTSASASMHNTSELVKKGSDGVDGKWFSDAGDQLCYTAHGDEESRLKLVEYIAKKFVMSMKYYNPTDYPQRNVIPLQHEDNGAFCTCSGCEAYMKNNNGANSAAVVRLCNDVITLVRQWQDDPTHEVYPYRRDDLKVSFFVYGSTRKACAVWDEAQQKYVATSPECDPNEYTIPWLCPGWSYVNDIYSPSSDSGRQTMDAWDEVSDEVWYWAYEAYYLYDAYFKESFNFLNSNLLQWYAATGCTHYFDNLSADSSDPTCFRQLQVYLWQKLSWDSNLDTQELTKKYFNAMYDGVADEMYSIYKKYIDHSLLLQKNVNFSGPISGGNPAKFIFWSYSGFLKPVVADFEMVLEKLEDLYAETDHAYYELIKSRVCVEYIQPLYHILDLFGRSSTTAPFTEELRQHYKDTLKGFCEYYYPVVTLNNTKDTVVGFVNSLA